ncbi:RNA recognition motif domain-containing protein [Labilithrix luteola]|nr:RNA-binding protein [Labilithrix luteola]
MANKLYVTNLPPDATEDAVRLHFAACGGVSDVQLVPERDGSKPQGLAYVTMTSATYASTAVGRLDGSNFGGNVLRVSDRPIPADKAPPPNVRVVQQFRERANMTYELECSGTAVTFRLFPIEGDRWRFEARTTDAANPVVVTGAGRTRSEALDAVVREWNVRAASSGVRPLDGTGLTRAMAGIKAV